MSNKNLNHLHGEKEFLNLSRDREKIIKKTSPKANFEYTANQLAKKLHPKEQFVKVAQIISLNDHVKTFVLQPDESAGTLKLAYFKPGQYISICVEIDGGIYSRPMTLCCSPKCALKGEYRITVYRVENGIVSNFFLDEVKEGFHFKISAPLGDFCYSSIRDHKNVLALANGYGILPFISMAEAIFDDLLDCHLTILYEAKTKEDLVFKEKLDDITCKSKNVTVVYVLSEEDDNEYESGVIDKKLILQFKGEENSYFVSGSTSFYARINDLLKELDIAKKFVRHDLFRGEIELKNDEEFSLTVLCGEDKCTMKCRGSETLLQAMEKNGIAAPNHCHVGVCGFCRSKLISGKVKTIDENIRMADKVYNYVHPCVTYPESDIILQLPN